MPDEIKVPKNLLSDMITKLVVSAEVEKRKVEVKQFNQVSGNIGTIIILIRLKLSLCEDLFYSKGHSLLYLFIRFIAENELHS